VIVIRLSEASDYDALSSLHNAVYPDNRLSAAELEHFDAAYEPPCQFARFVTLRDDVLLGSATYEQHAGMYHPQQFYLTLFVSPEAEGQGLGGALYSRLLDELALFHPTTLRAQVKETQTHALRFATRRGFTEEKRDFMATLEPQRFDDAPFAGAIKRFEASGFVIRSLAELSQDPEMPQKFYDLFSVVRQDVPRSSPATPIPFETFFKDTFAAPDFFPEGSFVALDGERYIGLTQFWRGEATDDLFTGLTAVRREYRRRGVALALKVHALRFARELGAPLIYTDNDSRTAPMIALNDALGFVRQPAYLSLVKRLDGAVPGEVTGVG
jgi:GNAT superfamily N-acetyltransferase